MSAAFIDKLCDTLLALIVLFAIMAAGAWLCDWLDKHFPD